MKKNSLCFCVVVILVLGGINNSNVWAGSKDMVAGKRNKFKDDSSTSMKDMFMSRETESKKYREKMLSNSNKMVKLLTEIRDLLR